MNFTSSSPESTLRHPLGTISGVMPRRRARTSAPSMARPPFYGSISAGRPVDLPTVAQFLVDILIPAGESVRLIYLGDGDYSAFGFPSRAAVYYDDDSTPADGCFVVAVAPGESYHDVFRVDGSVLVGSDGCRHPITSAEVFGRALGYTGYTDLPSPHSRFLSS